MARILIVDDSPSQLLGMKRIVEKLGHEALTAEDGAAGVEAAKRERPDLILMDVVMPNLNGFQATRTISKDPDTSHIPVMLVTTKDQETDKVWGTAPGCESLRDQTHQGRGTGDDAQGALARLTDNGPEKKRRS